MSIAQRSELAVWLLETHPTQVLDGTHTRNVSNFVFGGLDVQFDQRSNLDRQVRHNLDMITQMPT